MLCHITIKQNMFVSQGNVWIIDVPDALYMEHMAIYGHFKLSALSDGILAKCTFLGKQSDLEEKK